MQEDICDSEDVEREEVSTDFLINELNNDDHKLSIRPKWNHDCKSEVWRYFGNLYKDEKCIDRKHVYCKLCLTAEVVKRYKATTSTNSIHLHLSQVHNLNVKSIKHEENQKRLSAWLNKGTVTQNTTSRDQRFGLARDIAIWFSLDLLPFNDVSKPGFKYIATKYGMIKHGEQPPNPSTVSKAALQDVYNLVHGLLKKKLSVGKLTSSITFDCWTDNFRRLSYITYTLHYISDNWELQHCSLKTSLFDHPHTGQRISKNFEDVLCEFDIAKASVAAAVTDSGSNIISCLKILKVKRISCVAHGLHLLVGDLLKHTDMQMVVSLITKMRKSHKAMIYKYGELKREFELEKNSKILKLIEEHTSIDEVLEAEENVVQSETFDEHCYGENPFDVLTKKAFRPTKRDSKTRWNSTLLMLQSFARNKELVRVTLEKMQKYELILTNEEHDMTQDLIDILEAFRVATEILCGSSYPTLNLLLFRSEMLEKLREIEMESVGFKLSAVDILLSNIDKRLPVTDENVLAAIMDPSTQNLSAVNDYIDAKGESKLQFLRRMAKEMNILDIINVDEQNKSSVESNNQPATNMEQHDEPKWKKVKMELLKKHITEKDAASFESEVCRYQVISEQVFDPVEWWKSNKSTFPLLSHLAKTVLCITATSAPSERVFSLTGAVITAKRANLHPLKVEQTLFIHENYHFTLKDV